MVSLPAPPARRGERGSLLIGAVVMVSILLIGSAVAVQQWSTVIRRDREEELIFRGRQIAMALAMYRKDNGTFPTDLKQIQEMGGPGGGRYYLRHLYKDPVNGNADWGLVYLSPQGVPVDSSGQPIGSGGTGVSGGGAGGDEDDPFGDEDEDEDDEDFGFGESSKPGQQQGGTGVNNQQAGATGEVSGLPIIGVHSKSQETAMGPARWRNIEKYSEWTFTVQDLDSAFTLAPAVGPVQPGGPGGGGGIGQPGQPGQPGGPGNPGNPGQVINPQGGGQSIQPR